MKVKTKSTEHRHKKMLRGGLTSYIEAKTLLSLRLSMFKNRKTEKLLALARN